MFSLFSSSLAFFFATYTIQSCIFGAKVVKIPLTNTKRTKKVARKAKKSFFEGIIAPRITRIDTDFLQRLNLYKNLDRHA